MGGWDEKCEIHIFDWKAPPELLLLPYDRHDTPMQQTISECSKFCQWEE